MKLRSGTNGLNEELGRHLGREGESECTLCGAECDSVVHVLCKCTAYSSRGASFTENLQELLGDSCADFDLLSNVEKTLMCQVVSIGRKMTNSYFSSLKSILWTYGT